VETGQINSLEPQPQWRMDKDMTSRIAFIYKSGVETMYGLELGRIYAQTFKDGEVIYFIPRKLLKNKRLQGQCWDLGCAGRSKRKPSTQSIDPRLDANRWVLASPDTVPAYVIA
jgi:hypothetical protein